MKIENSSGRIKDSKIFQFIKGLAKNGVAIIFIGILVIMAILTKGKSLVFSNIVNIMMQATTIGIVAIGMTLVIIDRGIDLSVGGIAVLSSSIGILFMTKLNVPWYFCILIMLFNRFVNRLN